MYHRNYNTICQLYNILFSPPLAELKNLHFWLPVMTTITDWCTDNRSQVGGSFNHSMMSGSIVAMAPCPYRPCRHSSPGDNLPFCCLPFGTCPIHSRRTDLDPLPARREPTAACIMPVTHSMQEVQGPENLFNQTIGLNLDSTIRDGLSAVNRADQIHLRIGITDGYTVRQHSVLPSICKKRRDVKWVPCQENFDNVILASPHAEKPPHQWP